VWEVGTAKLVAVADAGSTVFAAEWIDDGRVLFSGEEGLYEWDVFDTMKTAVGNGPKLAGSTVRDCERVRALSIFPDREQVLLGGGGCAVSTIGPPKELLLTLSNGATKAVALSADAELLAFAGNDATVHVGRRDTMPRTKSSRKH
jgi:hypothetical protein